MRVDGVAAASEARPHMPLGRPGACPLGVSAAAHARTRPRGGRPNVHRVQLELTLSEGELTLETTVASPIRHAFRLALPKEAPAYLRTCARARARARRSFRSFVRSRLYVYNGTERAHPRRSTRLIPISSTLMLR
jgi:hypothetical protein